LNEREKYEAVWGNPNYRVHSPGMRLIEDIEGWLREIKAKSVIDVGCGTGRVLARLSRAGLKCVGIDIATNACTEFDGEVHVLDVTDAGDVLPRADAVLCTDMLEHVPPDLVDACLSAINVMAPRAYLQIALFKDAGAAWGVSEPLHLSLFSPGEWVDRLERAGFKIEHKRLIGSENGRLVLKLASAAST